MINNSTHFASSSIQMIDVDPKEIKRISKFLSLILRHKPEVIGIRLDENGWTDVTELLVKMNESGTAIDKQALDLVVSTNPKQRFAFSGCGLRIRANQGHSVEVDLDYEVASPPEFLYHGTPEKVLSQIRMEGLRKMKRHHVHLQTEAGPCIEVARRYGKPVLLLIHAQKMSESGFEFFETENSVWLTEKVPPEFIEFPEC